jgi:DNA replication and repair protein RecF
VLPQRNALLKQIQERRAEDDQLRFWDERLCELGAQIIHRRALALTELEQLADPIHRKLSGGSESLRIAYQPSYDPIVGTNGQLDLPMEVRPDWHSLRLESIQEGMAAALLELRSEEISRGQSLIGPHRDEIGFKSNGMDLRYYGSRGQNRTAMLSLKLAEIEWIFRRTERKPILLLDEVMAELDRERRDQLLERVHGARQSILTTADLDTFGQEFNQSATMWRIEAGQLLALES